MNKRLPALLALLTVVAIAGCDHVGFRRRVDIQVEVTATQSVTFSGTVFSFDQADIDFFGTTPFTAVFANRRLPVEVSIRRSTGRGVFLTLCVTDLDRGRRRCHESTSTFVDVEV